MKYLFILLGCLVLENVACTKESNTNCTAVIVTQSGTVCSVWGIREGNKVYPSGNIPDAFKQEGLAVCADYQLYEDMRLCACCGGTWANIKSMKYLMR